MNLDKLTEIFVKLEGTNSRNEMTEIVANFLESLSETGELRIIINLLQGQHDLDKLGVGESMILDSLVSISGYTKEQLKTGVAKFGDAGSIAEEVLSKRLQYPLFKLTVEPSVKDFYDKIRHLGEIDSYKAKIRWLSAIFNNISPSSAKYAVRIILGILRLGISTQTLLDALAVGVAGDKKHKEDIENAYNVMPTIGDVAVKLKDEGMEEISITDAIYNTPVRPMLASRLKLDEIMPKMGDRCFGEYKLDGERAQIHITKVKIRETGDEKQDYTIRVKIFSRKLTDITEQYPDIVSIVKSNIKVNHAILDGEIVAYNGGKMLPFQVLMKRKRKHDIKELVKEVPTKLYLFDILKLGEKTQFNTPYLLRRDILAGLFADDDKEIELVKNREIIAKGQLVGFFEQARKLGYEGVVLKGADSLYKAGKRGVDWVKLKGLEGAKMLDTLDVAIIGGYHGMGRRQGMAGAFLCGVQENGNYVAFTKIGSGFTDKEIAEISVLTEPLMLEKQPLIIQSFEPAEVWIEPRIVIEIMCDEITRVVHNGAHVYSVRFPVFKSIRTDKGPKDVTTLDEIKEMYEKQ